MNYKLISDHVPFQNGDNATIRFAGVLLLVGSFIGLAHFEILNEPNRIIVELAFVLFVFLRRFLPDWVGKKDILGSVSFDNNSRKILFKSEIIEYDEIKNISIRFNHIKGKQLVRGDVIHNGISELTITTNSDKIMLLRILTETEDQMEYLKSVVEKWYRAGINIREEFTSDRLKSLCLNPITFMTYQEVQELNKKIGEKDNG